MTFHFTTMQVIEKGLLTVAVCGVLCPIDAAVVIDGEEPLRPAEELADSHVTTLHVVVVPAIPVLLGAVHDGGQFLRRPVTVGQQHAAQEKRHVQAQSGEQIWHLSFQCPFAHYNAMLWVSMSNILECQLNNGG